MKLFPFSITLIITLQTFVYGQSTDRFPRWHFGAVAGPNFTIYVPKTAGFDAVPGVMTGVDLGYRLQNSPKGWSLHLQPYFLGSRTSTEFGTRGTASYSKTKSKTRAIYLPLLVRYTITGGKVRPFAEIGTVWNVWNRWYFKSTFCDNAGCYDIGGDWETVSSKERRFSALVSAGVQVDVGKVTIPITVRVLQLLKKKETFYEPFSGSEYTIPTVRTIQVTTGITF
ncbi:outer membrane beta-barrel protein [Dyadobacter endophyticus]|uniref:outer membrane beta-barrel protein n=1 Tax=Dyadobacter TaxID=120831 RepID=UPI003CEACE54